MSLTQINKAGLDEIALDHVFTIGASGTDHYTFQGEGLNGTVNDPTLYLTRGKTYRFENGTGAHAIRIQSADDGTSGTLYNTGVTNNNTTGTVIVEVQHDAPDVLYYQCASHANMKGTIYVTGALADGGVTTAKLADGAVTADKIASQTITANKIAADAVGASELADSSVAPANLQANSVITAKIANEAVTLAKLEHGTSSNDGKFLRANNGADPSFETVTTTNINGNVDHRVITATGTAQQVQGESGLTYDGSKLTVTGAAEVTSDLDIAEDIRHAGDSDTKIKFPANDNISMNVNGSEMFRITPDGALSEPNIRLKASTTVDHAAVQVGGSKNYSAGIPRNQLGVADAQAYNTDDNGGAIAFHAKYHANGSYTTMGSIEGIKTNNSSGNYDGALVFKTRVHGGNNTVGMRLTNDGLCFNSDTAAANALDDYEEGTYVPTVNGNMSLQSSYDIFSYVKIGKTVTIRGLFYPNNNPSSNDVMTFSLPFASANYSQIAGAGGTGVMHRQIAGAANGVVCYIQDNSSNAEFYKNGGSGNWQPVRNNDWQSGLEIYVQTTYFAV